MRTGKALRATTAVAAAVVVATAGCSTRAPEGGGGGGGDGGAGAEVATDVGVEGTTITLGVLTDLTGVFASRGQDITNANTLFWQDNQVSGTYTVGVEVQETTDVPQTGVERYSGMDPDSRTMQQTIG